MKKLLLVLGLLVLVGCWKSSYKQVAVYDFEALRDSLNLDSTCIFVEECSPLYTDDNPYNLPFTNNRIKTLFYTVQYNEFIEGLDTAVFGVCRDNGIIFWGSNKSAPGSSIKELIEWTINNREKI